MDLEPGRVAPGEHHLRVERLARRDCVPQARKGPQPGPLHDGPVLGRGHAEDRHALALDHCEPLLGVEACVVKERSRASQPWRDEGVAGGLRPAARRGAPAKLARVRAEPVLRLDPLAVEVALAVADRLRLAGGAGGEGDEPGIGGGEVDRGRLRCVVQPLVAGDHDGPVEAALRHGIDQVLGRQHHARSDPLDPRREVLRPQLLVARQRDGADAEAGHHGVDPLGPVADHGHHHLAAPGSVPREGGRQPGGAIGHLAERDLAPVSLAVEGDQGRPLARRRVDDLAGEVHPADPMPLVGASYAPICGSVRGGDSGADN